MFCKDVTRIANRNIWCITSNLLKSKHAIKFPSVQDSNIVSYSSLSIHNNYKTLTPNLQIYRFKYGKKQSQSREEESDADSDDDKAFDDEIQDKSTKLMSVRVNSLRADLLLKAGLGIARNKVEAAFYDSRIRVNGKKIFKKSIQLRGGDEVDIIRGLSPMNPDFLVVSRVEVLSVDQKEEDFSVKVRRSKSLVVENYSDPWKRSQPQQ